MRPWYRIHVSTLSVLAIVLAWLVFVNIPGDRTSVISYRFYHGWPYHYFEREGTEFSYWSFAGTTPQFHADALTLNAVAAFCILALAACASELWIRRNGRLFRFSTRSLLAVTALFATIMGLGVRELHECYRQQAALAELARFGSVTANRDWRMYDWFRSLFGAHFHGSIRTVGLVATRPIDRLPDLRSLENVVGLGLELPNIPENIEQVVELRKLKYLDVTLTSLTARDRERLTALTELPQLWGLGLLIDDLDDDDVLRISRDTRLEALAIGSPKITEKSLSRLSELKLLTNLTLDQSIIQNQDCSALSRFPKLSYLNFIGNNFTAQDEQKMRNLWPDARIVAGTSTIAPTSSVWKKSIRMWRE